MPKKKSPQEQLSAFWSSFHSRSPGKVTSIFPRALYANLLPSLDANHPKWRTNEHSTSRNAQESYEAAARECRARVRRIVRECERTNEKFTDPDFDIERDPSNNCLNRLIRNDAQVVANDQYIDNDPQAAPGMATTTSRESCDAKPVLQNCRPGAGVEYSFGSIHRVDWIFENPQFTINGFSSSDIKQGSAGDCWWLAAIATIAHRRDLMDRVCVARDEECGVYGFVFQRDGEWVSTVIDDNLYLKMKDFSDYHANVYDHTGHRSRTWRKRYQTGSEALYFARCDDPNETWLPLLEKAFAKCHGDYESLTGGWPGEAVEDMTGGVTTTIMSNRVLRRDKLWRELASTDGGFVFSLAAMGSSCYSERNGIAMSHAYSILQSREESDEEGRRVRLVKIRNPWGQRTERGLGEWAGAWSDGSKEWTPYWLAKLGHEFGDDGVFWMSFDDMLQTFSHIHRTRLFDERWTVVQRWTAAHVAWVTGYLRSKFVLEVKEAGLVVLVLAQLDDRYFEGFAGGYSYELHFTLQKAGAGKGGQSDQICRVRPAHDMENRSVSCEVELEAGRYEVLPKITATREKDALSVGDLVKKYANVNPQKLRQVGMQYDLAHAKGGVPDEDGMLESKKTELKRKKAEKKKRMADKKQKAKAEKQKQRTLRRAKRAMRKAKKAIDEVVNGNDSGDGVNEAQCRKTNTNTTIDTNGEQETKDIDSSQAAKRINDDPVDNPTSTADSTAIEQESKHDVDELAKLIDDIAKPADDETTPPTTAAVIPTLLTPPSQSPASQSGGEEQEATAAAQSAETEAATETEKTDSEDSESGSSSESDTESDTDSDSSHDSSDDAETPWNAVCVIGLRVYARDPSVSVSLVKPDDDFEGAALTVDGEPAGATM
ncbi:hypothetical protein VDGD_07732 [Verticillium dahliae]|nr:hypothetical protein VDGD_07732 [Verticillium dahliae]